MRKIPRRSTNVKIRETDCPIGTNGPLCVRSLLESSFCLFLLLHGLHDVNVKSAGLFLINDGL